MKKDEGTGWPDIRSRIGRGLGRVVHFAETLLARVLHPPTPNLNSPQSVPLCSDRMLSHVFWLQYLAKPALYH